MDTAKLDQLMDLVGEMVIAQTLIAHSPVLKAVTEPRLQSDLTQLARITASVQRITTGLRMVPIGLQFQKTARVVRDLSRRAGKQVLFETTGENTEVDKTVAEEISDPLLHMVRNSIDHGIEPPAERVALGKDPTARITLAAYHQSGQIVITISDDGRGLNRDKIFAKAVERGIIQASEQLTDNEVFLLIFEAGFSTADKVTDISGRGVGMDVVRRHVQALRGRIDIQSTAGQGTTFFLRLPLTLAMIEGLVVAVGDQRYVAPVASVREMFRPLPEMLSTLQGSNEMVLVRDHLLPIVRLHRRVQQGTADVVVDRGHAHRCRSRRTLLLPLCRRPDWQAGGRHQESRTELQPRCRDRRLRGAWRRPGRPHPRHARALQGEGLMPAHLDLLESPPVLHAREFEQIRDLAYRHFGIDLGEGKHTLVEARIGRVLRDLGMKSFQHYFDYVTSDSSGEALAKMVDVLTTNHTSFFREAQHFTLLAETIFPSLNQRSQIHLWSAACSSGEEPYSIAMSLLERSRELYFIPREDPRDRHLQPGARSRS